MPTLSIIDAILFWLALLSNLLLFALLLEFMWGNRQVKKLAQIPPLPKPTPNNLPLKVSIIIACRNEARNLKEALVSVLSLNYPDYEVILINDRSTDETPEILAEIAANHPQLQVIHIQELPSGWLGKNHALWVGAHRAQGEYLLFTDADIIFHTDSLSRCIHYALTEDADHLTVLPQMLMPGFWNNLFLSGFGFFFMLYSRPWHAANPKKKYHIGVGAFNLLKTSRYFEIGGHQVLALRPDDDMKLGKRVKQCGLKQRVLYGQSLLTVEWYASLPEAVVGLEKNSFAGLNYDLSLVIISVVFPTLLYVWPYIAIFFTSGLIQGLNALIILWLILLTQNSSKALQSPRWAGFFLPFSSLIFSYIITRATLKTLAQKGIYWRDTFYPLEELRQNTL